MSSTPRTASTPSEFEAIFQTALDKCPDDTLENLQKFRLDRKIDECQSPELIDIFRNQAKALGDSKNKNSLLIKYIEPVTSRLYDLVNSPVLNAVASLAFPPATAIFSSIGVILSIPSAVKNRYNDLFDIFGRIEVFVKRVEIYTEISQPTDAMTELVVKIMAEVIFVLALTAKRIRQGKWEKFKNLLGDDEIKSALQTLDQLTGEEYGMVHAQVYRSVTKEREASINKSIREWLSPPDTWEIYDMARNTRHRGPATWFTEDEVFQKWKSEGSFLWVNGIPGSGKTIISSNVIDDIQTLCRTRSAVLAFFYFSSQGGNKWDVLDLLSSFLLQLSYQSDFYGVLSSAFPKSARSPPPRRDIDTLSTYLRRILTRKGQPTIYFIIDALDECPSAFERHHPDQIWAQTRGREAVFDVLQELADLKLSHLRFCVTSRLQIDIEDFLKPLNPCKVSLDTRPGHIEALAQFVKTSIDSDRKMRRWSDEMKDLVINALGKEGGGMFLWAKYQLDSLRSCNSCDIPGTLKKLPKTLDGTYEKILSSIPEEQQKYAHRMFQWLTVSSRPLSIEEVAEVISFDFDVETSGIPKFDPNRRESDSEEAVRSACLTLVNIIDVRGEKVVQFSHFSVKEYLMSDRVAKATLPDMSRVAPAPALSYDFQVLLEPAHTLLAKASLGVLLWLDDSIDKTKIQDFPLAQYAAEYWHNHAMFGNVASSNVQYGINRLFVEPHFAAWLWLYDMDGQPPVRPDRPEQPRAVPLYYAASYGLYDLAVRLVDKHPKDVNAEGGVRWSPLFSALLMKHPDIARLLLERGANVWPREFLSCPPLWMASYRGYDDIVKSLIDGGADPNEPCVGLIGFVGWTPLLAASRKGRLKVAEMLLEKGADVNCKNHEGTSSLHIAASWQWGDKLAPLLLDHHAESNITDKKDRTPLHFASFHGQPKVIKSLLERGADLHAKDDCGYTALHVAAEAGQVEIVQLLLNCGAHPNERKNDHWTALHLAADWGHLQVVDVLLKGGADPLQVAPYLDRDVDTPFQLASRQKHNQIMRLLSERPGERMEGSESQG